MRMRIWWFGGMDKFVRIDREFVLEASRWAKVEGKEQTLVYCSSSGSSSSSLIPYSKSKGLTEEGLASLSYHDTLIFRPGMLVVPGGRAEHRLVESLAAKVTGFLSLFSSSIEIKTPILGNAMIFAALSGRAELAKQGLGREEVLKGHKVWTLGNADALKAGEREERL
ncbi:hypothetical protein BCR35DRAFT_301018 [Leucosporidium creatinivorum]|uniref:NAD(P)-binding domain-containing protein n=1 Tax=Leucosporidium creatinivorum TaxID=106004 RepID=A0A1Y2FYS8_9BASI|nr:hypothetical protein BCR35DRAFT_301018 [Leucosporidium creatinivorum]